MLSIVVVTRQCYFNNRLSEFSVFTFFLQLKDTRSLNCIFTLCGKRWLLFDLAFHKYSYRQVCIQPPMSAVNMTLPAFVGQRGTCCTAPLLLSAGACYWSISSAHRALSCKPTARRCCCRSTGRTDERTGQGRGGTASPTFLDWNSCKS